MSWRTIFKIKRKLRPFDVPAKLEAELEAKDQPRKKRVTRHEQPLQVLNVDVANTGPESPAPRDADSDRCKHGCKEQTLPFPGEIPANFGNVQFELELPEKRQKSLLKDRDSKQCVTEINRDSEAGPSSRPDFQTDRVSLGIDEPLKPETVEMVTADVQTGPELEEDYREYRNLMDRDCSMQVIPAQLWAGLGVSTSTHQRDVISREAQITQTVYHMRSSHIEIVENVTTLDNDKRTENRPRSSKEIVSEPTSRSPSKESEVEKYSDVRPSRSADSLKRRDSWDNKPDDQPEYTDEPCICRPGFPPRGICAFWRDKPPVRTKRPVKMDYCTRLLFWLFFLLKLAILLCIWFLLIYGFFFTGGYIYKNPEPIVPIKDLNTYLDPEEGAKNFIINNSRDSVHILITFNGPFKFNLRTHLKNHFNIQYERWYINNSDFDPNNLKRPEWPSEELRYPKWEVTMTNQSANWLIEVQHRSALMTYTVTNTSTAWYWKVEDVNWFHQNYYTVSYTHTTAVYAYRINYTSFPMDSYDLIKKHRLYNYNFNVFSKNHNYSQRFEDFRTSPGRKHTHDKILANGTSDDELTFIYVLRYVLNMTDMNMTDPSLLSGSNGTSTRFRNWEPVYSTKKDLLNFTSILNSSIRWNPMAIRARKLPPWDASNIESHPQRNLYLEEVGAELEEVAPRGPQWRRAGDDSLKSLLVPFTMRLVYGTDKRYTTTTTTFPPPKVVKANEGIKWLGYLLAGALFLLLFQADLMAMYYIIAVAVISLVSYLGVREPLMLEQFMRLDEVIMMLYCMLLVIFLSETGLYGFLAHHIHKFFNDRVYLLMVLLCTSTVAVTTYLTNNIVTIIFMTPLGIRCSEEYDLNPVPVLIMMIVYANYAGVMTPMSSYTTLKIWQDPNFPNNDVFDDTKNLFWMFLPMFAAVMTLTTLYFTLIFLILKPHLYKSTTLAAFDHERVLWQRMYAAIVPASGNNIAIRREIRREIIILENQMKMVEHRLYANPQREPVPPIVRVPEEITIRKKCLLVKIIISFIFFVLYSKLLARKVCLKTDPETNESSLCFEKMSFGWIVWVSLGILIIIIKPNWNFMMRRVDWASIVAFMALYVIEHVLVLLHIPEWFFEKMPPENSLVTVGLLTKLFWYSAGTTAILNGIVAIAMWLKYAVIFLGNTETVDAAIEIFTIILTQGVNMGGALTLISSPVGIVCANAARQQGYNIGFLRYMLYAVPITLINLIVLYSYYVPSDIQIRDKGRRIIRTTTIATSAVTAASTERA